MPEKVNNKKLQEVEPNPSICSCEVCDSIDCFVKRNQNTVRCTCGKCSETCLVFQPKQSKIKETKTKPIKNTKNYCKEIIKSKVVLNSNLDVIESETSKYYTRRFPGSKNTSTVGCASIKDGMCYDNQPPISNQTTDMAESLPTPVESVTLDPVKKINSTAKLSAQIMNVPYSEFETSMSFQKPVDPNTKLVKFDILDRIKKAYEACSCKICECIPSMPIMQYERCNCKPCECNDCRKLQENLTGNDKKKTIKLIKNNNYSVSKKMSTSRSAALIVAPVGESTQQGECTCNPCECMECDNTYGTINTHGTHEMSTGISRHINCRCEACLNEACDTEASEICRCEGRGTLMRKPVEKDTNDFDIRSAVICKTKTLVQNESNHLKNRFLINNETLKNSNNKNFASKLSYKPRILSKEEKKGKLPLCSQDFYEMAKILKRSEVFPKRCNCESCKCEFCSMKSTNNTNIGEITCVCKECACLNCEAKLLENNDNTQNFCLCQICECTYCNKLMNQNIKEICDCEKCKLERGLNKLKKTRTSNCIFLQSKHTDETVKNEQDLLNKSTNSFALSNLAESVTTNQSKFENMSYQTYRLYNKISCFDSALQNEIKVKMKKYMLTKGEDTSLAELKNGFKCDTFVKCGNGGKIRYVNKFTDVNKSESCVSAVSSNTSKGSFIPESISTLQNSKNNTQYSIQSSCNSSGHDHSDYLILFPRTTVGTCIKDVMNLDLNSNINLETINVSNKPVKKFNPVFKKSGHYTLKPAKKPFYTDDVRMLCSKVYEVGKLPSLMRKSCKHNHPGKLCDCNSCDCENCTFSKIKQSSCQCDCIACNCCGVCLNENQSIVLKKNEGVQTPIKSYQDRSEDSIDWKTLTEDQSYENNLFGLETQIFPLIKRKTNYIFGQNTELIPLDSTLPIDRLQEYPYKYFPLNYYDMKGTFIEIDTNMIFPLQDNYKSLHNALKEARVLSSELMQVLEKYEKANQEFESFAQKLQGNKVQIKKVFAATSMHKIVMIDVDTCYDFVNIDERVETIVGSNQTDKQIINDADDINNETDKDPFENSNTNDMVIEKNITQGLNSVSSLILEEVCKKLSLDKKDQEFQNRYAKYRKLIKRAVRVANRFKANSPISRHSPVLSTPTRLTRSANEYVDVNSDGDFQKSFNIISQEVKGSVLIEDQKLPTNDLIAKHIKDIMLGKRKLSLNKTVDDVPEINNVVYKINNENVFRIQIRGHPMFASKTTCSEDYEAKCRSSLEDTSLPKQPISDLDLNELVDPEIKMPIINNPLEKDIPNDALGSNELLNPEQKFAIINSPVEKLQQFNESRDNMKITFERVDKVSDHTIIIRWHPPLDTESVDGYEVDKSSKPVSKKLVIRGIKRISDHLLSKYHNNYTFLDSLGNQ